MILSQHLGSRMLDKLFNKKDKVANLSAEDRARSIAGSSSADQAALLLTAPTALMQLSEEEGKTVVSYMLPKKFEEGTVIIKEGDEQNTDYMILILSGEVTVESIVVSRRTPVTTAVLGAGSLIGEMGIVDGEPRSATCTATSDLKCAILTRAAMEQLMQEHPEVGGKLMMAVCQRIAQRMRETAEKLKLYVQLTQAMQQEIDRLMPT
jgi:CRP/FNR family transcriptional regulator, cyclic AMP receptor protein